MSTAQKKDSEAHSAKIQRIAGKKVGKKNGKRQSQIRRKKVSFNENVMLQTDHQLRIISLKTEKPRASGNRSNRRRPTRTQTFQAHYQMPSNPNPYFEFHGNYSTGYNYYNNYSNPRFYNGHQAYSSPIQCGYQTRKASDVLGSWIRGDQMSRRSFA